MTPYRGRPKLDTDVRSQLLAIERDDGDGDLSFGRGMRLHVTILNKIYFLSAAQRRVP